MQQKVGQILNNFWILFASDLDMFNPKFSTLMADAAFDALVLYDRMDAARKRSIKLVNLVIEAGRKKPREDSCML